MWPRLSVFLVIVACSCHPMRASRPMAPECLAIGGPNDITLHGEIDGYTVLPGCADGQIGAVVVGLGTKAFGDVAVDGAQHARAAALERECFAPLKQKFAAEAGAPSRRTPLETGGISHACTDKIMHCRVSVADWKDVDRAAELAGEVLREGQYGESVAIEVIGLRCVEEASAR